MMHPVRLAAPLGTAALIVSLAACSSSGGKHGGTNQTTGTSTASTPVTSPVSSSSSATNYAALLLDATDIPIPGVVKGTPAAPPQGTGATVAFTASGDRTVGDTVIVLPDNASATTAYSAAVNAANQSITNAVATSAPIGGGGTAIRGTNAHGAVAALVFTEGKALIVLEFDSAAADPVPTSLVQQIATAQDAKVKAGLPS